MTRKLKLNKLKSKSRKNKFNKLSKQVGGESDDEYEAREKKERLQRLQNESRYGTPYKFQNATSQIAIITKLKEIYDVKEEVWYFPEYIPLTPEQWQKLDEFFTNDDNLYSTYINEVLSQKKNITNYLVTLQMPLMSENKIKSRSIYNKINTSLINFFAKIRNNTLGHVYEAKKLYNYFSTYNKYVLYMLLRQKKQVKKTIKPEEATEVAAAEAAKGKANKYVLYMLLKKISKEDTAEVAAAAEAAARGEANKYVLYMLLKQINQVNQNITKEKAAAAAEAVAAKGGARKKNKSKRKKN